MIFTIKNRVKKIKPIYMDEDSILYGLTDTPKPQRNKKCFDSKHTEENQKIINKLKKHG